MEGFLVNTYKAYKARETKLLVWLKETSGYDKTPFRVNQIPLLAKSIVEKGLAVPDNVVDLLKEVVSKRKEAGAWYRHRNIGDTASGHAHILDVLEDTLATLKSTLPKGKRHPKTKGHQTDGKDSKHDNENPYEHLNDEEEEASQVSGDDESDVPESSTAGAEKNKDADKKKPKVKKIKSGKRKGKPRREAKPKPKKKLIINKESLLVYDDEDELDDLYFIVYCAFQDFNRIREYIQDRWRDYQQGLLSLSTVAITTNTAFELLQRAEKELLSMLTPEYQSYDALSQMLFIEVGLAHVDYDGKTAACGNDETKNSDAIYEEADFLCLPRYWDLVTWLKNVPPRKVVVQPMYLESRVKYEAIHAEEKMKRDQRIIYEMAAETTLLKALHNNPNFLLPGEDEFTLGMIAFHATREIPIWLVFACQIQCDIRGILEYKAVKCHDELLAMAKRAKSTLNTYANFMITHDFINFLEEAVDTTLGEIGCWVTDDFCGEDRDRLWISHGFKKKDLEPFYYLRRHPLLCGMMIFRFSLTMNEIGLKATNGYGSVISSAHLYNAMRHEKPDFAQWDDMEALILIHSYQRIFWHDSPPTNPAQYSRSYDRATGIVGMINQRKNSTGMIKPDRLYERGIAPASVVSAQYHERFCFGWKGRSPPRSLPNVERLLNHTSDLETEHMVQGLRMLGSGDQPFSLGSSMSKAVEAGSAATDSLIHQTLSMNITPEQSVTSQYQETKKLSMIQLLNALCTRAARESYTLNFDYFSFCLRCLIFLKAVSDEFEPEIKQSESFEDGVYWDRGELPCVPYIVFKMIEDADKRDNVLERLGRILKKVIDEEGNMEIKAVRAILGSKSKSDGNADEKLTWSAEVETKVL